MILFPILSTLIHTVIILLGKFFKRTVRAPRAKFFQNKIFVASAALFIFLGTILAAGSLIYFGAVNNSNLDLAESFFAPEPVDADE